MENFLGMMYSSAIRSRSLLYLLMMVAIIFKL